jgi:putative inorganic carbon (hco3(-)) transporter
MEPESGSEGGHWAAAAVDEPLLWAGALLCALAIAAALAPLAPRRRFAAAAAAVLLGGGIVLGEAWGASQVVELRERPVLLLAAAALAAAALAGLAALFRRRPRLLPLALLVVLPFRIPVEVGGETANLLLPLYAVLAAGLLAALLAPRGAGPVPAGGEGPLRWVGPALGVFIVLYALQAAISDNLEPAVQNLGFFFAPFAAVLILLASVDWDRRMVRDALAVLAGVALLVAAVGFAQYAARELFWNDKVIAGNEAHSWFRVNSLLWDPNIMGRYLAAVMTALAAALAWSTDRRRALLLGGGFAVLLAALAITFSQSSMLALLAGLIAVALLRWGPVAGAAALALVAAGLALAVFAIAGGGLTAETTGRTGLISGGLELAGDRPLHGYGSGAFADVFERRFGAEDGIAVESHTEPITVAAEQGAIGLLAYLVLLGTSLTGLALLARRGSDRPLAAAVLALYVVMVVHSLGYAAFFTDPITWALLGVALTLAAAPSRSVPAEATAGRAPAPEPA